jgi:hypothetical protein
MDNFEKENKLVWDAWYASSDAIKGALGNCYTRENYEMIAMLNVAALITDFDHANADEIKKNGDDLILFVRELIDLKLQALNANPTKH